MNGSEIGPQGTGPAVSAVKMQDKFFGRLLARKPMGLELLLHLSQQAAFAEKLSLSSR